MRTKLVAGNWKMNLTQTEAKAVVESLIKLVDQKTTADVLVCPPYLAIECVRHLTRHTHVRIGGQDVFWKDSGAFTGNVSAPMLRDAGCTYCIVGHSETRGNFGKLEVAESTLGYFSETDETINLKIKALLFHSLVPILCVGETLAEREAGRTDEVVSGQVRAALAGIEGFEFATGVIAYEPVWAIGTGKVCETPEAERVCALVRKTVIEVMDQETADQVRVLYGGSVKSSNSGELFRQPNIDGGLVGGASLNAQEFAMIILSA